MTFDITHRLPGIATVFPARAYDRSIFPPSGRTTRLRRFAFPSRLSRTCTSTLLVPSSRDSALRTWSASPSPSTSIIPSWRPVTRVESSSPYEPDSKTGPMGTVTCTPHPVLALGVQLPFASRASMRGMPLVATSKSRLKAPPNNPWPDRKGSVTSDGQAGMTQRASGRKPAPVFSWTRRSPSLDDFRT